jgi:hypothetical protein
MGNRSSFPRGICGWAMKLTTPSIQCCIQETVELYLHYSHVFMVTCLLSIGDNFTFT